MIRERRIAARGDIGADGATTIDAKALSMATGTSDIGSFAIDLPASRNRHHTAPQLMTDSRPARRLFFFFPGRHPARGAGRQPDVWIHPIAARTAASRGRR